MTALYTRYRSQRFDALVGQDAPVRTLKNAISSGRLAHAYLFTGIRGTGKTSTARILAKAVNCLGAVDGEPDNSCASCQAINDAAATDLIEIDAASNRGIDDIRDLREKAQYLPALLRRKVYIIDEAHQLSGDAFNALLKTLEEPPEHVLFILCTTESHKLPATIISRCQRFDFRRIGEAEIAGRLAWIGEQEGLAVREDGIALLAAMAQGSMRDAITMLDQMASSGVDAIDAASVRRQLGLVTQEEIAGMLLAAARGDAATVLRELDRMAEQGADMRQLGSSLAEMARRAVLLSIGAADAAALGIEAAAAAAMAEVVTTGGRDFAARGFELAVGAGAEMRQTHDPRLLLELTLLKLATTVQPGTAAVTPDSAPSMPASAPVSRGAKAAEPPGVAPATDPRLSPADPAAPGPAGSVPAAATPAPAAVEPGIAAELADLRARWPLLLDTLRGSGPATRVRALLKDAAPVALDADLVTLGFRFAMLSEKAQEPLHRAALEAAMSQVYGRAFRLAFRVVSDVQAPAGGVPGLGSNGPARSDPGTPAPAPPAPREGAPPVSPTGPAPAATATTAGEPGPAGTLSGEQLVDAAVELLGARITDIRSVPRPG